MLYMEVHFFSSKYIWIYGMSIGLDEEDWTGLGGVATGQLIFGSIEIYL